jgi:serine/threonine protein phosphatase 1
MPRQIVIGDVHGCWDELRELLDVLAPARDDALIAVGDLVNRGPDSAAVLRFFRDTPGATALRGNHEQDHIDAADGADTGARTVGPASLPVSTPLPASAGTEARPTSPPAPRRLGRSASATREQLGAEYPAWATFMRGLPTVLELPGATVVHGLWEPGVPPERQRDAVRVATDAAEAELTARWGPAWYEHYDGPGPLIVGHHHYRRDGQPLIIPGRVYALDTGCVFGGRLTALVLPEWRIVSVPARRQYYQPRASG